MLKTNADVENIEETRKKLIEKGYIEVNGDPEDKNAAVEKVYIERFKQDIDYTEPLNLPIEELDMNKIEIAKEFAEWLVRKRKDIKTVKLDPARNSKQIWWYDEEEKVWNKGGEDKVSEILYAEIPEQHSKHLEEETKTKVHRIDPITLEKTGTGKGEVPLKNGILEIEEQELREIERQDYLTSKIPVEYDLQSTAPEKFLDFLEEVTRNKEDMKKLQEFIGYCPTDSGKSVFLGVIRELLGPQNIAQQSLQDLTNGRKWGLANLVGKIANIDHDLDPEAIEDIGTVKKITSGNPITVEPKWEQPYDYTPTAKHMFSANRTPSRDKEDEAFYNRWLTVVFPRSIPREEQDPELLDELTEEEELKKILNWAIAGYHRLENQGQFTGVNGPYATREIWKEWGNSVERFITKFMITERKKRKQMKKSEEFDKDDLKNLKCEVHTSTAYEVYQKYAVGMDMEVKSKQAF
ncbi:MAG: phage/plasmid primase, P4 family, partial [Candidatus Nanohaloarchaea archaeon]